MKVPNCYPPVVAGITKKAKPDSSQLFGSSFGPWRFQDGRAGAPRVGVVYFPTVDGCEILHHQTDGWNLINTGINLQDFAPIHSIRYCNHRETFGNGILMYLVWPSQKKVLKQVPGYLVVTRKVNRCLTINQLFIPFYSVTYGEVSYPMLLHGIWYSTNPHKLG